MKKKLMGFAVSALSLLSLMPVTAFADDGQASTVQANSTGSVFWTLIFPLIIMFVLLYFVAIKPQKKREQELKEIQDSMQVGDEIVTGGGIVGIIVSIGEDTVVIETGGGKTKIRVKKWAINENITSAERIKAEKAKLEKKKSSAIASAGLADKADSDKKKKSKKEAE